MRKKSGFTIVEQVVVLVSEFEKVVVFKRFVKIRRYGIYNHTVKRNLELQFVPEAKPDIDILIKQKQPKK